MKNILLALVLTLTAMNVHALTPEQQAAHDLSVAKGYDSIEQENVLLTLIAHKACQSANPTETANLLAASNDLSEYQKQKLDVQISTITILGNGGGLDPEDVPK